jgi:hypothetical protein
MKALKIDRLCGPLGVTKGTFHWHFDGMHSYRTALIEAWGNCATKTVATSTRWAKFPRGNVCRR